MRPGFLPTPVNDGFGDPAVYVHFIVMRRAILLDLRYNAALLARASSPRHMRGLSANLGNGRPVTRALHP